MISCSTAGARLSPRHAGYAWIAVYVAGIAGTIAISALNRARYGIRTFDFRMFAAFLLFIAFGIFCNWFGHFTPRQMGTFWPIYFMLMYCIAGLWFGYAFIAIGLSHPVPDRLGGRLELAR